MVSAADLADPGNYYFWIITLGIAVAILGLLKGKIQMLFTITSFAYPNAKYNAMGNDYVKKPELEALIEARSFQDAVGILATRNYPIKEASIIALKAIKDFVTKNSEIHKVVMVLFSKKAFNIYLITAHKLFSY